MFILHPQLEKDCYPVMELSLSMVLLMDDSHFPWLIQVPQVENVKEVIDLNPQQQQTLWQESALLGACLQRQFQAEKLNIATLGNQVPQLHVHHIARYKNDAMWPNPVWGGLPAKPYARQAAQEVIDKVRQGINLIRKEQC